MRFVVALQGRNRDLPDFGDSASVSFGGELYHLGSHIVTFILPLEYGEKQGGPTDQDYGNASENVSLRLLRDRGTTVPQSSTPEITLILIALTPIP